MIEVDLIVSALWTLGLCLTSSAMMSIEIKLVTRTSCLTYSQFDWTILGLDDVSSGLPGCDVYYAVESEPNSYSLRHKYRQFSILPPTGTFRVEPLMPGKGYDVAIKCGDIESNTVTVTAQGVCPTTASPENSTVESEVVAIEQESVFTLSDRDTVLGIVFGLFGFCIIAVSTYCIAKKIRQRRRHERIRRYVGSSLIDPFDNLQSHTESGSQRLMGSTESLS